MSSTPATKRAASPDRPAYMRIFHNLLKRHSGLQPKFILLEQKVAADKGTPPPSLSFSNKSAPSFDASTNASDSNKTNTNSSGKEPTNTMALMSLKSYETKSLATANKISSPSGSIQTAKVGSFSTINTIDLPFIGAASGGASSNQNTMPDRRITPADRNLRRALDKAKKHKPVHSTNRSPVGLVVSLPSGKSTASNKFPLIKLATSKGTLRRDSSAPSVSHAPQGVLGNSSPKPTSGSHRARPRDNQASLAKTIAEQTPNAFKTLGPGFNNNAPTEKSLTLQTPFESTLGNSSLPSDYEHIFHAPSQIIDTPNESSSRIVRDKKPKVKSTKNS